MPRDPHSFRVHCALEAFEKADDPEGNTMRIGGIVSTDELDQQGERIVQQGLDFAPFLTKGWFNDNHGQKTTDVLGYPTAAKFVRKGERLPTGKRAERNGWWAEGYLLNTEQGRQTWQLCQALSKSPRRLGFSIEGSVTERHKDHNDIILSGTVKNVAVTHCPVNMGTEMSALAKALTAGSSIANPGSAPGEGFSLRQESLDKSPPYGQEGASDNEWEAGGKAEQDPNETENLTEGQGDDPNNGGWAGMNPHQTTIRSPREGLPPRQRVAKAEAPTDDFRIVDELDMLDEWGPILSKQLAEMQPPARLSKAESRIILGHRFPHLSAAEVDDIINHAANLL